MSLATDRNDSPASMRMTALPTFKIADLTVLRVGVGNWLKISTAVASEDFRDDFEPLALCLYVLNARLRAFDESAALFLGDHRRDVSDQLPGSIGGTLPNLFIGDHKRGAGVLALLEEALIDAPETSEP